MRKSIAALALLFALPAGVALAEPQDVAPPAQQQALQPGQQQETTELSAYRAFKANVNPNVVVPTTGVYDEGDAYVGRHGFPLGGWSQINLPSD